MGRGKKQVQTRNNCQLATRKSKNKPQLSIDNCRTTPEKVDYVIEQIGDLITMPDLKPWYCKAVYSLGAEPVLKMASIARADAKTTPPKFFSYLLNRELKKHRATELRQPSYGAY